MATFDRYARKPRIAADGRKAPRAKPTRMDSGAWGCSGCGALLRQWVTPDGKKRRTRAHCDDCSRLHCLWLDVLNGRRLATAAVSKAKEEGLLPRPETLACVDCGKQAAQYDHRDYGQPLNVDPVCRSCNNVRGHAKPINPLIVTGLLTRFLEAA